MTPIVAMLWGCSGQGPGGDSQTPDALPEGFESLGVQTCAAPAAAGWSVQHSGFQRGPDDSPVRDVATLVHDLDGDGDQDAMFSYAQLGHDPQTDVYLFDGVWAHSETLASGGALSLVDLDGDTALEVVFAMPPSIWERGERSLLDLGLGRVQDVAWLDLDDDGRPDMVAGLAQGDDHILHNSPDGGLLPWVTLEGTKAFDLVVFDADGDHDDDIYVVNDRGPQFGPNVLWTNVDGDLTNEDSEAGVTVEGMSADAGDFDNDGDLDLYLANTGHNMLLSNVGEGAWVDVTAASHADPLGTAEADMAWNAVWLDADNDGWLDVLVARGDLPETPFVGNVVLLLQEDGVFTARPFGEGSYRAVVPFDHNGDGVLDWIATPAVEAPELWVSDGCTANGWLAFDVPNGSA